jgi:hypothetical protein
MIPGLEEIYSVIANEVYEPMFLGKAAGPDARREIFERFRLANSLEWVAYNRLDKVECAQGNLSIDFDPVAEVFPELRLEDGVS